MNLTNQYKPDSVSHPGDSLAELLAELNMGPKEFAVRTGKPEKTIIAILKGSSSITADMAVLFESVLHIPASYWLNRQKAFDEMNARARMKVQVAESIQWAKQFPISDMIKLGWLPNVKSIEEKTIALLQYFRISNCDAWTDYYEKQILKNDFRISLSTTKEPQAISAWLRQGEILSDLIIAPAFNAKSFETVLQDVKILMSLGKNDFFTELCQIVLAAGVKVVYTPFLPKAPISGSTRWINDNPVIQLSARNKRYDIFWFTFFHEAGHIMLHGKKDIFLEEIEYDDIDKIKELEADNFAGEWLLSTKQEEEILEQYSIDEEDIVRFSKKFMTHPSVIVGRLQRKGFKRQNWGRQFFPNFELSTINP